MILILNLILFLSEFVFLICFEKFVIITSIHTFDSLDSDFWEYFPLLPPKQSMNLVSFNTVKKCNMLYVKCYIFTVEREICVI